MKKHGQRIRVDTTVMDANIHHPTDASLLADGVRVLTRLMRWAQKEECPVSRSLSDLEGGSRAYGERGDLR